MIGDYYQVGTCCNSNGISSARIAVEQDIQIDTCEAVNNIFFDLSDVNNEGSVLVTTSYPLSF